MSSKFKISFKKINYFELFFPVLADIFSFESYSTSNSISRNNYKLANNKEAYKELKKLISKESSSSAKNEEVTNEVSFKGKKFITLK